MSRRYRFGGLAAWAACMLALGTLPRPAVAAEPDELEAFCADALPLVWVDDGSTSPELLDEAARQASRIWAAAGIALRWARSAPGRPIRSDEIVVVVRRELVVRTLVEGRARTRRPLGRLIRASAERPGRLIELALPDITGLVLPQSLHGHKVRDLPPIARDRLLGRALGRVVAHEIGHWLFGRDHADEGLMRASIRRPDLIAADPPPLPAAWPATARDRLRTYRPCPAPRPVPAAARGERGAWHRDGRGARRSRREEGEYREYSTDEQRRAPGWIDRRMPRPFHRGLPGAPS